MTRTDLQASLFVRRSGKQVFMKRLTNFSVDQKKGFGLTGNLCLCMLQAITTYKRK